MTNLTNITRENAIELLKKIDGSEYRAEDYKGKRVHTLVAIIEGKQQNKEEAIPTSDEIERNTDAEMTLEQEQELEKDRAKHKLRVMDMTNLQKVESLTPKQRELIKKMKKISSREKGLIHRKHFMPVEDKRACYSIGGVLTTLMEKGIVLKIDSVTYKIASEFQSLI